MYKKKSETDNNIEKAGFADYFLVLLADLLTYIHFSGNGKKRKNLPWLQTCLLSCLLHKRNGKTFAVTFLLFNETVA